MKLMMVFALLICAYSFNGEVLASDSSHKVESSKESTDVSKPKKKRRKKVEMCHECGKPETECDCEGHGNDEDNMHKDDKKT